MPSIVADAPYVTLINLFRVAPADQLGLVRVQLGDMYWYGRQQPGNVSASFHRSLDGVRVFNYGQWSSPDELAKSRGTPDFEQHIRNMRFFDYAIEPTLYKVTSLHGRDQLTLDSRAGLVTRLTTATIDPAAIQDLVRDWQDALENLWKRASRAGFVGAALHVALNGTQVAEYSQWSSADAVEAACDHVGHDFEQRLAARADYVDTHLYELAGSSDDK